VRRLNETMTFGDIIAYNMRDDGSAFTIFEEAQPDRVMKARELIENIRREDPTVSVIVEPGCSTGDIAGYFSGTMTAMGFDVVPAAVEETRRRWPSMTVWRAIAEDVEPMECDILVLCEFLEHIVDPVGFIQKWMPKAKHVVIGHPLVGMGSDPEYGHVWAYEDDDFNRWFPLGGHRMVEAYRFGMGGYPDMVIGRGSRL
jgi:hypothetical protein